MPFVAHALPGSSFRIAAYAAPAWAVSRFFRLASAWRHDAGAVAASPAQASNPAAASKRTARRTGLVRMLTAVYHSASALAKGEG
jgi:hypothetical protein